MGNRNFRPLHEAIWDYVAGKLLHVPVPGGGLLVHGRRHPGGGRDGVETRPFGIRRRVLLDEEGKLSESQGRGEDSVLRRWHDPSGRDERREAQRAKRRPFYFGSRIPERELPDDDDTPCVRLKTSTLFSRANRIQPERAAQPVGIRLEAQAKAKAGQARSPDHPRRSGNELAVLLTAGGSIRSSVGRS